MNANLPGESSPLWPSAGNGTRKGQRASGLAALKCYRGRPTFAELFTACQARSHPIRTETPESRWSRCTEEETEGVEGPAQAWQLVGDRKCP